MAESRPVIVTGASRGVAGLAPYPGGIPGLFALAIAGLVLDDLVISRPEKLPEGWNVAVVVTG
ncbi:hypothetical protein [Devosia aquimaris]|uniref:hypothetical protein n=1 Tax=Devosia aquimaris TaxID=2866214 RepID=UPI001CD0AB81|nr:hypothetical protein [Devosia sp. CJK-A8-3]